MGAMATIGRVASSLLIAAAAAACQPASSVGSEGGAGGDDGSRSRDRLWSRSLQCAQQSERFAARGNHERTDTTTGWTNHYNAKDDRCYVQAWYLGARRGQGNLEMPGLYTILFDAVEGVEMARHAEFADQGGAVQRMFCAVYDPAERGPQSAPCDDAKTFIRQRMTE